jgi:hypothetical protein
VAAAAWCEEDVGYCLKKQVYNGDYMVYGDYNPTPVMEAVEPEPRPYMRYEIEP